MRPAEGFSFFPTEYRKTEGLQYGKTEGLQHGKAGGLQYTKTEGLQGNVPEKRKSTGKIRRSAGKMLHHAGNVPLLLLLLLLVCAGCGLRTEAAGTTARGYTAPPFFASAFHREKARGENGALLDLSAASEGYIGVSAVSAGRLKFQVLKDGATYTYDLKSDGTPSIFPLQMEDGMYTFRVLENVSGSKYAVLYSTDETISIADQFRPFLCASDYVKYTETSACVQKAKDLAAGAADVNGVISAVYDYVCAGVKYDKEKARTVQAGYMPDPDETLATGKGICFDYASLAAAMLRSQGIPCKVIFGYVSPNEVYHAWNMFYTEENGWVTVKFEISGKKWNRMDLTFSSNGADGTFIGDGSNYKDVYCY